MSIFAITGDDTLTIYDRVFNDLADGDTSTITFPNNLVETKTGKDKNTIFSKNETGNNAEMILRLIRGSSDDKFLSSKLAEIERDITSITLASGEFVKKIGDGSSGLTRDVYSLEGGVINKKVEVKENVEGDTEQGAAIYTFMFANAKRDL